VPIRGHWQRHNAGSWESRGQYETWFNENVKPNVPAEIQQEVIELHAVVQP
jgi:hypothetical protein